MTTKIAVSLPDDVVAAARPAVHEGHAASVSAFVATALEHEIRAERLRDVVDDLDRELGSPDASALAFADEALGLS